MLDNQAYVDQSRKGDRKAVRGAASGDSKALIHTLVQLGKTLGLETLGEGIEEQSQLRHLQHESCDTGQGFLFARPLDPSGIEELLNSASPLHALVGD